MRVDVPEARHVRGERDRLVGAAIRDGADVVRWPYAAAPTAPIDERDVAAVAVRRSARSGHDGAEYVLTGPESLSQSEQVAIIGNAIGRPLRLEELTPEAARTELAGLFPPVAMAMLFDAWAAALGQPAFMTSTVAALTGTPAGTFARWAADRAAVFRP